MTLGNPVRNPKFLACFSGIQSLSYEAGKGMASGVPLMPAAFRIRTPSGARDGDCDCSWFVHAVYSYFGAASCTHPGWLGVDTFKMQMPSLHWIRSASLGLG